MAKTKIMTKDWDADTRSATLTFTDGQKIVVDFDKLPANIQISAALHGLVQKIGDAAAGHGDDPEKAFEACMSVSEQLTSGEWNKKREGSVGERPSMVVEAVYNVMVAAGKLAAGDDGMAKVRAKYTGEGADEARKKALQNPQVKLEYEKIKQAAAAKRIAELEAKVVTGATADDNLL